MCRNIKVLTVLVGLSGVLLFPGPASAEPVTVTPPEVNLAVNGEARLPIVVSEDAGRATLAAAEDLSRCLKIMTGAAFTTHRVSAGKSPEAGIVLGTLAEFPDPDLNKALAVQPNRDGVEAFVIRTEPGQVRLIGATDLGVSHAAYRLLEELGCRWLFPAAEWEVIPSCPSPAVSLNLTDRPKILSRRIWWGYGYFDSRCREDYEAWARRNRMAQSRRIHCGHAWQTIIASNRKTFEEHPEYLALVKGERRGPQLCVSNPAVRALAVQYALDAFAKVPDRDMISMETSDGSDHCECQACQALGSISERAFGLANEAARAVAVKHPGKMIGMLAYNDHCEPPSFPLEPNVYVQSTAGFIRGRYTHEELMELWPEVCQNLGFYEYFSVWLWDFDRPPGGRGANVDYICRRIRRYADLGATSLDCESGNNWGLHGRGYVLANRLMWNPDADTETILADFYKTAFGPAADTMRGYYERLDPGRGPLVSEHLLGLALHDLETASHQAARCPDVLARLRHLKQYLHYVRLRWEYDRAGDDDARRAAAEAVFTHVYRTRYAYMNHWAAIRLAWLRKDAEKLNHPAWLDDPPWKDLPPPTPEETEEQFRADMERYQPVEVLRREFSDDLVTAGLSSEQPAALKQKFQLPGRYACFSREGEPIELTVTTGEIAWYRDRPPAAWSVQDATGCEVASGQLPQDGEAHELKVPVPVAGLYWLDFDDQAAGWSITAEAGRPVCLALRRDGYARHLGQMQRVYFYVPRGTRRVDYFWKGRPHEVLGPDGQLVMKVTDTGKIVQITVPEDADGKAWSFSKLPTGQLWLFNCPNLLAASPDALLIPREVAEADGLASVQSLLPPDWNPKQAGDRVLEGLVQVTAPQVKGAHDAAMVIVDDLAYVVAEVNDERPGEGASWPSVYSAMSIVNVNTMTMEKIIPFARSEQAYDNETLPVGACFVPRIIQKDDKTLRCYFASEQPGVRQSQTWYIDFDLERVAFTNTIHRAKLTTSAGTFDMQPRYFHADATAHGFKRPPKDYGLYLFDSFKVFEGRTYVAINNWPGKQNALAVVSDELDAFKVIGHFNEPQSLLLSESAVNRLPDGTWMAICRQDGGNNNYTFTTSRDGKTWMPGAHRDFVPNGTCSKPTFDRFGGIYYLGWQEATQINGVHRSVFNVDVSRDGETWQRKYRFETEKSFQYPTFREHEGTIYLTVTQGDYSGSRKERIMFGRLESL